MPEGLKRAVRRVRYRGTKRSCPLCGSTVSGFLPAGLAGRADAMCPVCEGLERHRMLWLHLSTAKGLAGRRFSRALHFAPHPAVERCIRSVADDYLSADLDPSFAMACVDVTRMQFEDGSFDLIVCSHVLEHVPDDRKALAELFRVLMPNGVLILLVPMSPGLTVEDPNETDPREKLRRFGQEDHVRVCGDDYVDRIRDAGFVTLQLTSENIFGNECMESHGGLAGEILFECRRPKTKDNVNDPGN